MKNEKQEVLEEFVEDVKAVGASVKSDWPDLWVTYKKACDELGVEPMPGD